MNINIIYIYIYDIYIINMCHHGQNFLDIRYEHMHFFINMIYRGNTFRDIDI